ncbi:MAG: hypothetical protein A3J30_03305 [Candidatus Wildermuthbacteria bacterium RIFCSPLOWO2_02_FULL_47_9c]|uniref:Uncharacterized protein n=1 Tax=Candidatus Wildermuthbacteria bacterium RIFCSPLOWO2_02_FULL_47_9c TaxID=1802466 RepID=A0A1G2RTZ2_9BACT|nr:MAG: hypothetical protein A3B28_00005 [Candidatus Wildermuthbacteria bacterium RIFCSPLOWO2_01_FULL_50_46]OHA75859.1 MAG: hypothetical protein A3J30_03305 [Candidatus Wildermuthbacteria bacterium RIFCSPLOWO2_02_FULL_47_9c]
MEEVETALEETAQGVREKVENLAAGERLFLLQKILLPCLHLGQEEEWCRQPQKRWKNMQIRC